MLTRQRLAAGLIIGTTAVVAACSTSGPGSVVVDDGPKVAEGYRLERVVTGTALHSINEITIRPDGMLVATSLAGETMTEIDPWTGAFTPLVLTARRTHGAPFCATVRTSERYEHWLSAGVHAFICGDATTTAATALRRSLSELRT